MMEPVRWRPNATVAAVVERDAHFLIVEERDRVTGGIVFNQPAGHLERGESLADAVVRETLEETRWQVELVGYLGVARFVATDDTTYLRHTFAATPKREVSHLALDDGIIGCHWMTRTDIAAHATQLRSPLVLQVIDLYCRGVIAPLSLVLDS